MSDLDMRCFCVRCKARTKESYRLKVRCRNCGYSGVALLRKGDKPSWTQRCPHCEVDHLDFGHAPEFTETQDEAR